MAKPPTADKILRILRILDWGGRVELGDRDLRWLASELSVALGPSGDADLCEICETVQPIVIRSSLGRICEACLEGMTEEAEDAREQFDSEE